MESFSSTVKTTPRATSASLSQSSSSRNETRAREGSTSSTLQKVLGPRNSNDHVLPRNAARHLTLTQTRLDGTTVVGPPLPMRGRVVVGLSLGLSPQTVTAFAATAYGSGIVASALSPTMASKPGMASRLITTAECTVLGGGDEDIEAPAFPTLIPGPVLGLSSASSPPASTTTPSVTDGTEQAIAAVLSTTVCFFAVFGITACVGSGTRRPSSVLNPAAAIISDDNDIDDTETDANDRGLVWSLLLALTSMAAVYLGPNLIAEALLLILHASTVSIRVLSAVCLAAVVTVLTALAGIVASGRVAVNPADTSVAHAPTVQRPRRLAELRQYLSPFFIGARDQRRMVIRMHVFEDLFVACLFAALGALRPPTLAGCRSVAGVMLLLAVLHLGYLVRFQPYQDRVEQRMALLNAGVILMVGICTITALAAPSSNAAMSILGVAMLIADAMYFGQTIALAGIAVYRKLGRSASRFDETGSAQQQQLQVPVRGSGAAQPTQRSQMACENPLDNKNNRGTQL